MKLSAEKLSAEKSSPEKRSAAKINFGRLHSERSSLGDISFLKLKSWPAFTLVFFFLFSSQVQANPTLEMSAQLEELFHEAQTAYFEDTNTAVATERFKKVVDLAPQADWSDDQKKRIHFSMLRLAQLSEDENESESWILMSQQFAPQLVPDAEIFPPPFIEKYKKHLQVSLPVRPRAKTNIEQRLSLLPQPILQQPDPAFHSTLPQPLDEKPIWKNKWVWIGIGTLVASYVIYENAQSEPKSSSPTTTYGF